MKDRITHLLFEILMPVLIVLGCSEDNPIRVQSEAQAPVSQEKWGVSLRLSPYHPQKDKFPYPFRNWSGGATFTIRADTIVLTGVNGSMGGTGGGPGRLEVWAKCNTILGSHEIGWHRSGATSWYCSGAASFSLLGPMWETEGTDFIGRLTVSSYDAATGIISGDFGFVGKLMNVHWWTDYTDTLCVGDGWFRTRVTRP